jgi:hypothetical protein
VEKAVETLTQGGAKRMSKINDVFAGIKMIGFPAVAFLSVVFLCYNTIERTTLAMDRMTTAINANTSALKEFKDSSNAFQTAVSRDHSMMMELIRRN